MSPVFSEANYEAVFTNTAEQNTNRSMSLEMNEEFMEEDLSDDDLLKVSHKRKIVEL